MKILFHVQSATSYTWAPGVDERDAAAAAARLYPAMAIEQVYPVTVGKALAETYGADLGYLSKVLRIDAPGHDSDEMLALLFTAPKQQNGLWTYTQAMTNFMELRRRWSGEGISFQGNGVRLRLDTPAPADLLEVVEQMANFGGALDELAHEILRAELGFVPDNLVRVAVRDRDNRWHVTDCPASALGDEYLEEAAISTRLPHVRWIHPVVMVDSMPGMVSGCATHSAYNSCEPLFSSRTLTEEQMAHAFCPHPPRPAAAA